MPVRNEPNLEPFLTRLHEVMETTKFYEVLVVQGDHETLHAPIPELPHQYVYHTYGDSLERSILNGFSHARGDRIVVMDADGSHPPESVLELIRALEKTDMAVGTRFAEGSTFTGSPLRRVVTWGIGSMAKLAGSHLSDPMSGFFAVTREVLERATFKPIPWKTALEFELSTRPTVTEVPIRFEERTVGKSKTSIRLGVVVGFALLRLIVNKYLFNFNNGEVKR